MCGCVCVCVSLTSGEDSGLSVALQVAFNRHEVHGVLGARLQVPQEVLGGRGSHVVGAGLPSPGGPCCQLVPRDHGTGPRPQHQHRVLRGVEEPQVGGGIELWGGKAEHPSASQLNLHPHFQTMGVHLACISHVLCEGSSKEERRWDHERAGKLFHFYIHASVPSINTLRQADLSILGCTDLGRCHLCIPWRRQPKG